MTDDRWALFELVARFDDAVNRRDADEFARLWTPDAVWEIDRPRPLHIEGREAIVSTWTGMVAGTRWLFRGSFAGVVEVDGDRATGRWPCVETGQFADGTSYDNRSFYEDDYRRTPEGWRIAHRRYRYLWLSDEELRGQPVPISLEPVPAA